MNEEDEAFEDLAKRQGDWGMQGSRKHQIMRYAENVENKGTSMTDKEAMKLALFALDIVKIHYTQNRHVNEAIAALKKVLAEYAIREIQRLGQEIEQEPICPKCKAKVLYECVACSSNNYPPPQRTEPPQKKVWTFWDLSGGDITDAIKAKLKEKNQ